MFSTIKNIVTAPLAWFAANNDFEDTPGKRRRLPHPSIDDHDDHDDVREHNSSFRAKRIRLNSPDRSINRPPAYLDPPAHLLSQQPSTLPSTTSHPPAHNRHTLSPSAFTHVRPRAPARTMSMDPPHRRTLVPEPTLVPLPLSRDVSMDLGSPTKTIFQPPFRMRSNLTPQPSAMSATALDFGPNPQRRPRDPSAPPPLAALMENPIFVKPPREEAQQQQQQFRRTSGDGGGSTITLGSLVQASKSTMGLPRSHSTLIIDSPARPILINPAERALQELEIYRTPLVPTRLKAQGASAAAAGLPELFQSREKTRSLILMRRDKRDDKPRLGMPRILQSTSSQKERDVEKTKHSKPYAGSGSLKKLLTRRRQEEKEARQQQEKEEEDNAAMADDSEAQVRAVLEINRAQRKVSAPPVPATRIGGGRQASAMYGGPQRALGHGRPMGGRTVGPARTRERKGGRGRFSANYDEDEDEGTGVEKIPEEKLEAVRETVYEAPKGFSFAPPAEVPAAAAPSHTSTPAPTTNEAGGEPPIAALPFSLTASKATTPIATPTITPAPQASATLPSVLLIPPTPEVARTPTTPPNGSGAVPNFFANAGTATPTTAHASAPLAPAAEVKEKEPEKPTVPTFTLPAGFSFGAPATTQAAASASATLAPTPAPNNSAKPANAPVSSLPFSITTKPAATEPAKEVEKPQASLFGGSSSTPAFSGFGATPAPAAAAAAATEKPAEQPIFSFAPPSSTTGTASKSLFGGFGQPAPAAEKKEEPKSASSFGQPASTSTEAKDTPKSDGGLAFSFGKPASTATETKEVPKTGFSFGQTETQETPKSDGFSFGFGSAPSALAGGDKPSVPGFSFGAPTPAKTSTTSATNGSGFSFGTGAGTSTTATTEAIKPFSFGASATAAPSTPARPVTPPHTDANEMRMEESPTRDMNGAERKAPQLQLQVPGSGKPGFTFGVSNAPALFGQPSSAPFGSAGASTGGTGFAFGGQPSAGASGGGFGFGKPTDTSMTSGGSGFSFGAPKPVETAPTSSAFSFGQTTKLAESNASQPPAFGFGQPAKPADSAASPFSFGAPKPAENAPSTGGFSFGRKAPEAQRPASSGFGFGAPASSNDAQRPSSSGFTFGQPQQQPTSAPSTTAPFSFSSAPNNPNTFGGPAASTPASPAFAQPSPFAFGSGPTSAPSTAPAPFGFGTASQPSSPAVQASGFSFGSGANGGNTAPSSPFGGQTALPSTNAAPAGGAGSLFTMGTSAQQAAAAGTGPRQIKRLPTRRGAKR
ncbi:hypothetical protein DENSPDRAFT_883095 [Dentipellis sp. KUC8613]|nr:hypothetical protein DENSPDRAFT_883095 [Dentipellis sp. KUC8613]